MHIQKLSVKTSSIIPLMAALPYRVAMDSPAVCGIEYDPATQLSYFASRDFSTCREDESAGGIFSSKSDTKKDD